MWVDGLLRLGRHPLLPIILKSARTIGIALRILHTQTASIDLVFDNINIWISVSILHFYFKAFGLS